MFLYKLILSVALAIEGIYAFAPGIISLRSQNTSYIDQRNNQLLWGKIENTDYNDCKTGSINPVSLDYTGRLGNSRLWIVDPWIRPPNGDCTLEALHKQGDFNSFPEIVARHETDRVRFVMRPISRGHTSDVNATNVSSVGDTMEHSHTDNVQRHGVYLVDDPKMDGPCPLLTPGIAWTADKPCLTTEKGFHDVLCPGYTMLFPMTLIRGTGSNTLEYTTDTMERLIIDNNIVARPDGSYVLVFSCPWIQRRNNEATRTSHCKNGMVLRVIVKKKPTFSSKAKRSSSAGSVFFGTAAVVSALNLI